MLFDSLKVKLFLQQLQEERLNFDHDLPYLPHNSDIVLISVCPSHLVFPNDFLNYSLKMRHPVSNTERGFSILIELSISFKSCLFPIDFTKGNLMVGRL